MHYSPAQLQSIQKDLDQTANSKPSNLKNVAVGLGLAVCASAIALGVSASSPAPQPITKVDKPSIPACSTYSDAFMCRE